MTVLGEHEFFLDSNSAAYLKILTNELVVAPGSQNDSATDSENDSAAKLVSTTAMLSFIAAATLILQ